MKEDKILENVNARHVFHGPLVDNSLISYYRSSQELFASLKKLKGNATFGSNILDIRGRGLMVAM